MFAAYRVVCIGRYYRCKTVFSHTFGVAAAPPSLLIYIIIIILIILLEINTFDVLCFML